MKKLFKFSILAGLLMLCTAPFQSCVNHNVAPPVTTADTVQQAPKASAEWFCKTIDPPPTTSRATGLNGKYWAKGSTLRIGFLEGTTQQKADAIAAFAEWHKYANLNFVFPATGPYDCRIAFQTNNGAWSYVGNDASHVAQSQVTMNLGFNQAGTYLHEIGHFLGLVHEQSNPTGGICFDTNAVFIALMGPPNSWSKEQIRYNVFYKYALSQVTNTSFDAVSIMEYAIPSSWTCNHVGIVGGKVLSEVDKAFIALLYPGAAPPPTPTNLTITMAQRDNILRLLAKAKAYVDSAQLITKAAFAL